MSAEKLLLVIFIQVVCSVGIAQYHFHNQPVNFSEAKAICEQKGMELPSLNQAASFHNPLTELGKQMQTGDDSIWLAVDVEKNGCATYSLRKNEISYYEGSSCLKVSAPVVCKNYPVLSAADLNDRKSLAQISPTCPVGGMSVCRKCDFGSYALVDSNLLYSDLECSCAQIGMIAAIPNIDSQELTDLATLMNECGGKKMAWISDAGFNGGNGCWAAAWTDFPSDVSIVSISPCESIRLPSLCQMKVHCRNTGNGCCATGINKNRPLGNANSLKNKETGFKSGFRYSKERKKVCVGKEPSEQPKFALVQRSEPDIHPNFLCRSKGMKLADINDRFELNRALRVLRECGSYTAVVKSYYQYEGQNLGISIDELTHDLSKVTKRLNGIAPDGDVLCNVMIV